MTSVRPTAASTANGIDGENETKGTPPPVQMQTMQNRLDEAAMAYRILPFALRAYVAAQR